ncbi:MAG: hypothetical protein ACLUN9_16940 [Enterocloster aldenensis]|uniref:hypothetical protein n=1 Tax=Enterocloster aldenensis TaxID=358742 RepID=UPI000E42C8E0|nr:hypothetical protein DWX59_23450 [Enterocloster aldenensis]
MQAASNEYKDMMRRKWRNPISHLRISIGLINQQAQASAYVPEPDGYTYYSDLVKPMDNYKVQELYATCDQDYATVDGSMYFLPREAADVVLNQGIVSGGLLGTIEIRFPVQYDIKGLTVEFGKAYPVDFTIISDSRTLNVTDNTDGHFVTEEIFEAATFLRFVPAVMVNGQSRFRINQITMGIGIYFDGKKILSATKKEHISPISEEMPTIDLDVKVDNKDRAYDVENEESAVNFLEIGQKIEVLYGQALDNGSVEWIPGTTLGLRSWSADDTEMAFQASDCFDGMDGTYYGGQYHPDGMSLYDMAVDVLADAGVDYREYWIDPYLKDVMITNPMPAVAHKEALQLIANAGRCILYQDRAGKIFIKSSFVPDMEAASDNEAYFSNAAAVLDHTEKDIYALPGQGHTGADGMVYFLPCQAEGATYLNVGYVSDAVADGAGLFGSNPTIGITMEAVFKCFGLTLEFGRNWPDTVVFHSYYDGELQEDYTVSGLTRTYVVSHEFPEFDYLVLEFTKGCPNNRVTLDNITFGDSTDYVLEYGVELTKTPKGTQLARVRELQVIRTLFGLSAEEPKELVRETIAVTEQDNQYTFYLTNPSYGFSVAITEPSEGQTATILSSSAYYVTVGLTGIVGATEVAVMGKEYITTRTKVSRQLNPTGSLETWENPLVSSTLHAANLADWIGDYLKSDREYDLSYRGEPRMDANDIAFLENKYVPDLLIRVTDHTLKFNGGLSGTIKARRDMSYVATAKNRLAGQ